ncbi:MAG: RHS repeat protein, partial [Nitrospirae bacterium]|nr:RHS repeat protein [Nitrospirota bacterium]
MRKIGTHPILLNNIRLTEISSNIGNFWETEWGQACDYAFTAGNVTTMEYDSKGNLIQIQNPKSQITKINYNSYGQPTSITDALN